jgi:NADP-dependent 3-hydroxy acid dehydrogenase YdfG
VLISNAGIGPISPLDELKVDEWEAMIDVNLKGVLNGIAAALPVFREQGSGHFVNTSSTAAHRILPTMAVYAATKLAVNVISEGLRQEAGPDLRVTVITPGMTDTPFASDITSPTVLAQIANAKASIGQSPDAIARAMAFAIEQPSGVDVGEIIVRPTAQA